MWNKGGLLITVGGFYGWIAPFGPAWHMLFEVAHGGLLRGES